MEKFIYLFVLTAAVAANVFLIVRARTYKEVLQGNVVKYLTIASMILVFVTSYFQYFDSTEKAARYTYVDNEALISVKSKSVLENYPNWSNREENVSNFIDSLNYSDPAFRKYYAAYSGKKKPVSFDIAYINSLERKLYLMDPQDTAYSKLRWNIALFKLKMESDELTKEDYTNLVKTSEQLDLVLLDKYAMTIENPVIVNDNDNVP